MCVLINDVIYGLYDLSIKHKREKKFYSENCGISIFSSRTKIGTNCIRCSTFFFCLQIDKLLNSFFFIHEKHFYHSKGKAGKAHEENIFVRLLRALWRRLCVCMWALPWRMLTKGERIFFSHNFMISIGHHNRNNSALWEHFHVTVMMKVS